MKLKINPHCKSIKYDTEETVFEPHEVDVHSSNDLRRLNHHHLELKWEVPHQS